ncbi:MAG: DUF4041 domain-containing protein [Azoarcus sp.]|nr:DUF4041 domain-containing protein [Azoarcus sp.]
MQTKEDALNAFAQRIETLTGQLESAGKEIQSLAKYQAIQDIEAHIQALEAKSQAAIDDAQARIDARMQAANAEALRILTQAEQSKEDVERTAKETLKEARVNVQVSKEKAESLLESAVRDAEAIIARARQEAENIAGDAFAAQGKAKELAAAIEAMEHTLKGYGTEYIVPTYSLLDELADNYGHEEAGRALKEARNVTRTMIRMGRAATCEYVEANRRGTAVAFVVDAFNGKVDSILARGKSENIGKLEQEIREACALVNVNGCAFREARILSEFLEARIHELKCAAIVRVLQEREREEQRRIKEQIREEERARKEYERAQKEAEKEERVLRQAMEQAKAALAAATDAQRARYEAELADLQTRLAEAEAKGLRAISMAQQTKTGHVYVISNIGSFGEDVFKIGMTRRLDPMERVRELGDASVPFEFDVHAVLYSTDAPALESTLHRRFMLDQVNKVNPRKEFFRVPLTSIRDAVESMEISAHWTMTAAAQSYRESLRIAEDTRANPEALRAWEDTQRI